MNDALTFLSRQKIFRNIIEQYGIPVIPMRPQGFQTLVLLILEQQVSIDSAKATFRKIRSQFPNMLAEELAGVSADDFRVLGVSRQKAGYISGLARAILDKTIDLESFPHKTAGQVRTELLALKGIGNWTADIYLMFCLQSPDIIPLGDIAVINTIKELLGIHDKLEMERIAAQWAPHRSMATYLLWHHYLQKRNRKIDYSL